MVVFTCNHCGESLKKNKVEKHYSITACRRNMPALTCVDCLKDFLGEDHVAHTSCVTEQEKYSAKGFVSKAPSQKGKKKQEMWVNSINEVLNKDMKIQPNVRWLLQRIAEDSNVPQKKQKFINFCMSKFKSCKPRDLESTWEVLEKVKSNMNNSKQESNEGKVNSDDRKRKRVDSGNISPNDESNSPTEITHENGDLSSTKLQKKHKKNNKNETQSEADEVINEEAEGMKKDKKSRKKNAYANGSHSVNDVETYGTESNNVEFKDGVDHENEVAHDNAPEVKLSKKEKKQKRKQEKYEKQLLEIKEAVSEEVSEETENGIVDVNTKKKKKPVQVADEHCISESGKLNGETGNKKKKKHQEPLSETNEVEEPAENAEIECTQRNKFNWEEIIIKVLEQKGELPLKRLEKKVVGEYMNTCATVKSVEEALAKFHKKVMKIPRVKVRKEVAKLVS